MSTAEMLFEKEDKGWSRFSSAQLPRQYSPEDAIYDEEFGL